MFGDRARLAQGVQAAVQAATEAANAQASASRRR